MNIKANFYRRQSSKYVIYLADLVHNYASKGPHTFPINAGYIASYAKKIYGDNLNVKIFKFPMDLINAIKTETPDILALSNYTWNLDINARIALWIKSLHPEVVTVFGGPDYPVVKSEASIYLKDRPGLDFYVIGQGEKGFVNIVKRFLESESINKMKASPIENCSFYDKNKGLIVQDNYSFIENLEEIPSPYLTGLMDSFFYNLIPLIETNRGCPYTCTYCSWGRSSQKKILNFPIETVKKEIEYIAKRTKNTNILMIGDANFGILERDVKIAGFIDNARKKYGFPRHLSVTWAKATPNRIIKIIDMLGDMVSVTTSFQSMDKDVIKKIKRSNLAIDKYKEIQKYFSSKNVSTYSELILGLPGETKKSHLDGLRELFNNNAIGITCYNLRMLGGSELNTGTERKKYKITAKHRLIDGGFGKYGDILSIEQEEMVLATSTMSIKDILYFRPIHFLIQFLWNYKYYELLLNFLKLKGVNPVDFILEILGRVKYAPLKVRRVYRNFVYESQREWFDTKEELYKYYSNPKQFKFISSGGFGKLNYKYMYRFLLECKKDFDAYLFMTAKEILIKHKSYNSFVDLQLRDLLRYTNYSLVDFTDGLLSIKDNKVAKFGYDILKWKNTFYQQPLSEFKSPGIMLSFSIPLEQFNALKKLYNQFKGVDINQTMRKMVEYMNKSDLFYNVDYA